MALLLPILEILIALLLIYLLARLFKRNEWWVIVAIGLLMILSLIIASQIIGFLVLEELLLCIGIGCFRWINIILYIELIVTLALILWAVSGVVGAREMIRQQGVVKKEIKKGHDKMKSEKVTLWLGLILVLGGIILMLQGKLMGPLTTTVATIIGVIGIILIAVAARARRKRKRKKR
jgi:hypothetical protein